MSVYTAEAHNAGTVYRIHYTYPDSVQALFEGGPGIYMLESGWGSNYGEWIELASNSIAWSYLAEKMPKMAHSKGDKPGWIMAFAKAGVEVFG
jgi:hypothetical protein